MQLMIQLVTHQGDEAGVLPADVSETSTLNDLKMAVVGSAELPPGYPDHTWTFQRNGVNLQMADNTKLSETGIQDGDMLLAVAQPLAAQAQTHRPAPAGSANNRAAELEEVRNHILNHRPARAAIEERAKDDLVKEGETFDDVLNDPQKFQERWSAMEERRRAEGEEQARQDAQLNNEVNEENQARIMKRIQQERVVKEADKIMEEHPEMFGSVTMLYISVLVNGHPVKAFVDSGAQMTVISPTKAEECGLTKDIDERFAGIARGVGTARILGRVHQAPLTVKDSHFGMTDELPCSFTVMEGKGVDMLLGLDMLKRYQASIDLQKNCLRFPNGAELQFLPEHEIPKNEYDADGQTIAGGSSTASKPPVPAPPAAGNFSGAGRSLGSAAGGQSSSLAAGMSSTARPRPTAASNPQSQNIPQSRPGPAATQSSRPTNRAPAYSEESIKFLTDQGAGSRERAIQLLTAAGGNLDMAMSILFDM